MGSAINKNKKAINPRNTTGSTVKILKFESIIEQKQIKRPQSGGYSIG